MTNPSRISIIASLYPHQQDMVDWASTRKGGIIAAEMGLGKSLVALTMFANGANIDGSNKTLFVCPKAVVSHIEAQFAKHLSAPRGTCHVFIGPARDKPISIFALQKASFIITTYDILVREFLNKSSSSIYKIPWDRIFMDEAHVLRNPKTQKFKAIIELSASEKCTRWCISGTPIQNSMADIAALAKIINIAPYNDNLWWRAAKYDDRLDEWRNLCYKFVSKETNLRNLPPKHIHEHIVEMDELQQYVYDAFRTEAKTLISDFYRGVFKIKFGSVLAMITRLKQAAIHQETPCAVEPDEVVPSAKFIKAKQIIDDMPATDKVIIFSQYGRVLNLLRRYLDDNGYKSETYDGSLSSSQREDMLLTFKTDPSVRVLLISLQAGGVGLDIITANHVIFMDPWWNSSIEAQATDRAHRIGQTKEVHVHHIYTNDTIEEWIKLIQTSKSCIADTVLHGKAVSGPSAEQIRTLYETHLKCVKVEDDEDEDDEDDEDDDAKYDFEPVKPKPMIISLKLNKAPVILN